MQRDPQKRLGTLNDAYEVKQHMFFKGVDWGKVLRKEMKPPVPDEFEVPDTVFPNDRLYGDTLINDSTRIKAWTFVGEADL